MTLSRKYYRAIAEILRSARRDIDTIEAGPEDAIDYIENELIGLFRTDRAAFDTVRFCDAAA